VVPLETALASPTTYCDQILIGGDLDKTIKALNQPFECRPANQGDVNGVSFSAQGWTGPSEQVSLETGQMIKMAIGLVDVLPQRLFKFEFDEGDYNGVRRERILPDLAVSHSTATVRIDGIFKTTNTSLNVIAVEVGAVITLSPTRIMTMYLMRSVDTRGDDAAVEATAHRIIEDDLPQISTKQ